MRYPAVAGTYYSGGKTELKAEIDGLISAASAEPAVKSVKNPGAFIVPHGRMEECGNVMASAYATIHDMPSFITFVIIGTDHHGKGKPISISRDDWLTPLGIVRNDREIGDAIQNESSFAEFDERAHGFEPAVEVQLPFIQSVTNNAMAVEISVALHSQDIAKDLAVTIEKAAVTTGRQVIVVGSTDFSHDETQSDADEEDEVITGLIKEMRGLDSMEHMESIGSTVCGPAIIGTTVLYAKNAGLSPTMLKRKVVPTGKKDEVKSFVSFAFGTK